ncbi:MAG: DUF4956 domain-containing protein [Myxococcota bacterium]|nr:DUF4956 domain-containing protein [Deltaproteobacteria bacterium]MDQ3340101.1 DUF4956 domain-containing protein [Myxococcota bacterium]
MDVLGTDTFFDPEDFAKLVARLGIDLFFTTLVVVFVYYRLYRNREFLFTYYVFNVITYAVCVLLRKTPMDMGFALGLFAVFGILRYRTEEIRMRDLTYLFIVLGLGILNGVANKKVSFVELLTVNAIIVALTAILELSAKARGSGSTPLLYDKLELLGPGREEALRKDLSARIGYRVVRVHVHRIDLLRDAAEVTAYYQNPVERLGPEERK